MQINVIDLTPIYIQCMPNKRWTDYEKAYPTLFQHYHRYWADADAEYALRTADTVREKTALVESRLPFVKTILTQKGFSDEVIVVLFVGKDTTNGHAFWDEQRHKFVVWLPVEAYATQKQIDIFAPHELIHALHYTRYPEFYFRNEHQMKLVGRQIITEGMATFGTMQVMGCDEVTALWADYVSPEFASHWYEQCQNREREMVSKILEEWETSQEENKWFMMWDERDVTRCRGGYYVGLRVMQEINRRHKVDLHALLSLNAKELEKLALEVVSEMATKDPA